MFHHQDTFGAGQRDCAARTAFADNCRHHGYRQGETRLRRAGNSFRLPAFFRLDPRKRARRIDERNHWQSETTGHFHEAYRLAIALRFAHPEIVTDAAGRIVALFMADQNDLASIELGEATENGFVVTIITIAPEWHEILESLFDIVTEMRA